MSINACKSLKSTSPAAVKCTPVACAHLPHEAGRRAAMRVLSPALLVITGVFQALRPSATAKAGLDECADQGVIATTKFISNTQRRQIG